MLELQNTSVDIVKDNINNSYIQKNNHLMLGFISWHELFDKIIGIKQSVFNFFLAMAAVTTTFINNYVWDDAKAIYFMLFLIAIDACTGVLKAVKNKSFSSSRLPRILVIMVVYTALLAISWNISKFSPFYYWLPGALYGGFIATLIVSVFENLHELNIIPDRIYNLVKTKLDALQTLILGVGKIKRKKK
jgi:phage-related holin